MLIDWFTVGAQALNFIVLIWLLKRYLYKPILNAVDAREKLIADELADADAKKVEAHKEREEFSEKNKQFDLQRAELMSKAREEAKTERQRLFDDARQAADAFSAKQAESLRNDARSLNQAIFKQTQLEVFNVTRKALKDLAGANLEERICAVFVRRLKSLNRKTKDELSEAFKKAKGEVFVRCAYEIPATQQKAIETAFAETFSDKIHFRFEIAPDLVAGIELATDGQKISWTIADYLTSLEASVAAILDDKGKTVTASDPGPKPKVARKPTSKSTHKSAKPRAKAKHS